MNELDLLIEDLQDISNAKWHSAERWKNARKRANEPFMISLFGCAKLNHEVEITRLANIRWQQRVVNMCLKITKINVEQLNHLQNV